MPREVSTRQLAERFRQTKSEGATPTQLPETPAADAVPAVSKFTLKFRLEEAAAFDEWLALRARRELGRRVDKREVVLALLDELYRNPGLERRILDRVANPAVRRPDG
jgi:hypothetical protein